MRTISSRCVAAGKGGIFSKLGPPPTHWNKAARTALFAFFVLTVFALSGCDAVNGFLGQDSATEEPEPEKLVPFQVVTTVYVKENGGSNDGEGTKASPYQTVKKALKRLADDYKGDWPGKGEDNEGMGAIAILDQVNAPLIAIDHSNDTSYPPILLYGDGPGASLKQTAPGFITADLSETEAGSLITVGTGVTLTLWDITLTGLSGKNEAANTAALIYVDGGHLIIEEGTLITGNYGSAEDSYSGGVCVAHGTFTMTGGEISGNTAIYTAGGVFVNDSSTFTMTGGKISGNTGGDGGGVYFEGITYKYQDVLDGTISESNAKFTMTGGEISGNTAIYTGGGVSFRNNVTYTMTGGEISGNISGYYGGGIYIEGVGTYTMTGGEISGNTAYDGGGVNFYIFGTYTMTGGSKISGNTATSDGGGVFVGNGAFTMTGGKISGNTAMYNGGGVFVADSSGGTFTKSGGGIIDTTNSAIMTERKGVYVSGPPSKKFNGNAGPDHDLDSSVPGNNGGWE